MVRTNSLHALRVLAAVAGCLVVLCGCSMAVIDAAMAAEAQLSAPVGIAIIAGSQEVVLSWTAVGGATSYDVYWANGATATTFQPEQTPECHPARDDHGPR